MLGASTYELIAKVSADTKDLESGLSGAVGKVKGFASKIAGVAGAIGLGKVISDSLNEGGKLEQAIGGTQKLFGDAWENVKRNAENAYKTAGVSANTYLEGVNSFASSLLQSTGGNVQKSAQVADRAFRDMSDNANMFGSSMESIQTAYQGFAKQNYTMLDNLKLGYGGTKTEMERLLADASKLSGVKYDISNLADVYTAIGVIQDKLQVTGTTAKEASQTLEGSANAMKSAFSNLLGKLSLGEDIQPELDALFSTTKAWLIDNFLPMVGNVLKGLPKAFKNAIIDSIPALKEQVNGLLTSVFGENVTTHINTVGQTITTALSKLDFSGLKALADAVLPALKVGFETFMSIVGPAIEGLVQSFVGLWNAVQPVLSIIADALMPIFQVLASFLGGVVKGILMKISSLFDLLKIAVEFLTPVIAFVIEVFKKIAPVLAKVAEWVGVVIGWFGDLGSASKGLKEFIKSAFDGIKSTIGAVKDFINSAINGIKGFFTGMKNAANLLKGGISGAWSGIRGAIGSAKGFISGAINGIKGFFSNLGTAGQTLKNTLKTAWDSLVGVISRAKSTISGIIDGIKGIFRTLWNIDLFGAGKAIIDGLLRGIRSAFEGVKNFVGGIAGWIRDHKGPISYDKRLLIPAGKAIISGLNNSMMNAFDEVKSNVTNMGGIISELLSNTANDVNFGFNPFGELSNLNSSVTGSMTHTLGVLSDNLTVGSQPAHIVLRLGKHDYEAYTEDISEEQERQLELKIAYQGG